MGEIEVEVAIEAGGDGTHAADRVELHLRGLAGGQVSHQRVDLGVVDRPAETQQGQLVQGGVGVRDVVPAGTEVPGEPIPVLGELDGSDHVPAGGPGRHRCVGRCRHREHRRHAHESVRDAVGGRHVTHRHHGARGEFDHRRGVPTGADVADAADHVDELDCASAGRIAGAGGGELRHVHPVLEAGEHDLMRFDADVVELQQRPSRLQPA